MFQFVTLYYRVDDEMVLEEFFSKTHLPLAEQLPGLVKSAVSRVTGKPGGASRFHLAYTLTFDTRLDFERAMASSPGLKLMQALKPWDEAQLISWYYADTFEEEVQMRQKGARDHDSTP